MGGGGGGMKVLILAMFCLLTSNSLKYAIIEHENFELLTDIVHTILIHLYCILYKMWGSQKFLVFSWGQGVMYVLLLPTNGTSLLNFL